MARKETDVKYITKRSGERVEFSTVKIYEALRKMNAELVDKRTRLTQREMNEVVQDVIDTVYSSQDRIYSVEEIQDIVIISILSRQKYEAGISYALYRANHAQKRTMSEVDKNVLEIIKVKRNASGSVVGGNDEVNDENSNKNPVIVSVQRDYIAGEESKEIARRFLINELIIKAHDLGILHYHDMDYAAQAMHNCDLVNLEDMLQNGTVISGVKIDRPHSFRTACTVASQIVAQVASSQYGGQSINCAHLSPFIQVSREKIRKTLGEQFKVAGIRIDEDQFNQLVEAQVLKEVEDGCQTMQYQLITLQTTNGQAPFVSVFMYLDDVPEGQERDDLALMIKVMLEQRILGVKDRSGHYITAAFPKLLYVLDEDNVHENSKYFWLTELAAKCTAKRLVPDYISAKKMRELKGDVYAPMGCRSFLTPDRSYLKGNLANANNFKDGKTKYWGRFNQGVVTMNLPYLALLSGGDETRFWELMEEYTELAHAGLRQRHEHLKGTPSDVAPILWQDGAIARLQPGETIDKLLYDGYSTISLGYAGLYETVMAMKRCSHTTEEGREFGLRVMQYMVDKCNKWKAEENIDYSVYGTPLESTTYKFAKALKKRFGEIKDISDRDYVTNSYHINVREDIDAFEKLTQEAKFQELSPGGAISYVEVPNMQNNIPAVISIIRHIYNTILYAELNTKSDLCECCGFDGEIEVYKDEETGKLGWKCPKCGNVDQTKMHVSRRTCGYIGTNFWNQGRTQEIAERVLHLSVDSCV